MVPKKSDKILKIIFDIQSNSFSTFKSHTGTDNLLKDKFL